MAKTVGDPDELDRRIELVGEYRVLTGESVRKIAEHFTSLKKNGGFEISIATVQDYIEKYKKIHPRYAEIIEEQSKKNKNDFINNPEISERVLKVAKMVVKGKTIEEVSNELGIPYWVIYRDITDRLPKLDKELSIEISNILSKRSLDNLTPGNKLSDDNKKRK